MLAWLAARGVDRALGSSLLEKGDFPDVEALRAADAGALAALGISDEPGRAKLLQAIRSDELLKKKKKRKPRAKKNKGGADKSAQQLAEQLSNLQRRASEVDQLYSVAQANPPAWAANPILVFEVHPSLHRYRIFGSGAATGCRSGGYVGALIEGAIADTLDLKKMGFPAWSRVISPAYIVGKAKVE